MKALIVTALALALTACSSTAPKQAGNSDPEAKAGAAATRFAESAFDGMGRILNLVFDDQGNWTKIASAPSIQREPLKLTPSRQPS